MAYRILVVNWQDIKNPLSGGAEVHLHEIFGRIARWGHSVTLLCSSFPGAPALEWVDGMRVVRVGGRHDFNFRVLSRIKGLIRGGTYDLVVDDVNKIPFYSPLVCHLPLLVVVPHLFGTTVFREVSFPLASYVYSFELPFALVYRRFLFDVISASTKEDLVKRGIPRENIQVIHCGIDHSTYCPKDDVRRSFFPHLLYVGRVKRYKRIDMVLRSMVAIRRRVPGVKLTVIGAGDYLDDLRSLAVKLSLCPDVEFAGFVSQEEKIRLLRTVHLVINPSPKEGWGLTNVEAAACGTPVVAADSPGLRDSVVDGKTGLLFSSQKGEELVDGVVRLLSDQALWSKFSQNSAQWARTFNWNEAAHQTLGLIERVIARAGRRRRGIV